MRHKLSVYDGNAMARSRSSPRRTTLCRLLAVGNVIAVIEQEPMPPLAPQRQKRPNRAIRKTAYCDDKGQAWKARHVERAPVGRKRATSVSGRPGEPDQGGGDRRVAAGDILIKREAPSMRPTMLQAPARSWLGKRLGVQLAGAGVEKIEHCVVVRPVADRPP